MLLWLFTRGKGDRQKVYNVVMRRSITNSNRGTATARAACTADGGRAYVCTAERGRRAHDRARIVTSALAQLDIIFRNDCVRFNPGSVGVVVDGQHGAAAGVRRIRFYYHAVVACTDRRPKHGVGFFTKTFANKN